MPTRTRRLAVPLVLALALAAGPALSSGSSAVAADDPPARQSPIDVRLDDITLQRGLPSLEVDYSRDATVRVEYVRKDADDPQGCAVRDPEETEEAEVEPGAGSVTLDGTRYELVQFHFHTPSEHEVEGRRAPLEQHLVHRSADGRLLVIGVLLVPGRPDEADRVLARLPEECGEEVEVEGFDLRELLPRNLSTLRYQGSLTTAPYTEGVQWFLTAPQTVSPAGIRAFQEVFPGSNAREVQPLNGRQVLADLRRGR